MARNEVESLLFAVGLPECMGLEIWRRGGDEGLRMRKS